MCIAVRRILWSCPWETLWIRQWFARHYYYYHYHYYYYYYYCYYYYHYHYYCYVLYCSLMFSMREKRTVDIQCIAMKWYMLTCVYLSTEHMCRVMVKFTTWITIDRKYDMLSDFIIASITCISSYVFYFFTSIWKHGQMKWILLSCSNKCDLKTEPDLYTSNMLSDSRTDFTILRPSPCPDKKITQQAHWYRTRQEITLAQLKSHGQIHRLFT